MNKENKTEWIPINPDWINLPNDLLICDWKHPKYGIIKGNLVRYGGRLESEQSWWVFPVCGSEADIALSEFTHYRKRLPVDQPSPLPESVEETKDWTKPDENGDVDVPDYLMPLLNKLGFQLRFHTISGEGEAITLVRMTSIAEKFFKAHHSAEAKWKLCPKCNGTGEIYINELYKKQTTGVVGYITCDVCGGAKILASPSNNSAEVERLRSENENLKVEIERLNEALDSRKGIAL